MKSVLPPPPCAPAPLGPLGVCLPSTVGDVVQALPALRLLAQRGHSLHLMGPPWAADLLAGEGWACHVLPAGWREATAAWRGLREQLGAPAGALPAWVLRRDLASALAVRLGGWRGLGDARDGRAWLLHRAWLASDDAAHAVERRWHLACQVLGEQASSPPPRLGWQVGPAAAQAATQALVTYGLTQRPFVVLCPFATDGEPGVTWPHFAALAREWAPELADRGVALVICATPDEAGAARRDYPAALVIEGGASWATRAALLAQAELVVSGDGGLGHLAAAVGAPLLSVLGGDASDAPWGPSVQVLRRWPDWLEVAPVLAAARQRLAQRLALA